MRSNFEFVPFVGYDETELKQITSGANCSVGCDYYRTEKPEKVPLPDPVNQWHDFLQKVCPVNLQDWSKQTWMERSLDILKVRLCFYITLEI